MNLIPNQKRTNDAMLASSNVNAILTALDAIEPDKHRQKSELFSKLYPGIVRTLARKVPQKKILAELERLGLKLHPARFKEMLEAEARALSEHGDRVCCEHCGSVLLLPPVKLPDDATVRTSGSPDASGSAESGPMQKVA